LLPPTKRVTNKWGPRQPRRGRSPDEDGAVVAARHAASLLEPRLRPAEAGALSADAASRWRRRRAAALRRKRGGRCRDAPPPPVPPADGRPPEPSDPSPSRRLAGGRPPAPPPRPSRGAADRRRQTHRPPLPATVVARRVGGSGGGADGRRSDGWPSAAGKAGAPPVHSVGATAGACGGDGRRAKSRPYAPVRDAQPTTSSTARPPASSHSVSTLCRGPRGYL